MRPKKFESDLWIVVKRAPDLDSVWLAHCLSLDLFAQGDTEEAAFKDLMTLVNETVIDDLVASLDPSRRGAKTPAEDWEELSRITRKGARVRLNFAALPPRKRRALAINAHYQVELVPRRVREVRERVEVENIPPAWQLVAPSGAKTVFR